MTAKIMSFAVVPGLSFPFTVIAMVLNGCSGSVCVAMTCSTSEVPIPKARAPNAPWVEVRSEEHTSELQSRGHLVCRLLLEKKKKALDALPLNGDGYAFKDIA